MKIKVRGIIKNGGKVFLLRTQNKRNFYLLPGGTLEENESLKDGLKREFLEELGIIPRIGKLLLVREYFNNGEIHLDFWFEILNFEDFKDLNKEKALNICETCDEGFYNEKDLISEDFRPKNIWKLLENNENEFF